MIELPYAALLLRAARIDLQLTQRQLAARLGVSERTVQRWENGESDPPQYLLDLVRVWIAKDPDTAGPDSLQEAS